MLTLFAEEAFGHDSVVGVTLLLKTLGEAYHLHACGEVEHLWIRHIALLDIVHKMCLNR